MGKLIEIKGLSKFYKMGKEEVIALHNINLSIDEGEFVAITGQSGSGKTTLMNIMGCLDAQTSGDYQLKGKSILNMCDREISTIRNKEIGFIFQRFNLLSNMTALENVELPLFYRKISKNDRIIVAKKALEQVGLTAYTGHKPLEMSGGQQQRVAIARAIAQETPIILADEPTGNLDSQNAKEIMKILSDLNKEGKTVILITHDNEVALNAKRCIRIADGCIAKDFFFDI